MMHAAIPPPWTLGEIFRSLARKRRVIFSARRLVALRGAMLLHHPARPALADAETVAQHRDRPAPAGRAYQFPFAISRFASFAFIPPYWFRHR